MDCQQEGTKECQEEPLSKDQKIQQDLKDKKIIYQEEQGLMDIPDYSRMRRYDTCIASYIVAMLNS